VEAIIRGDGWARRARVARGFRERLVGLRDPQGADSLLLKARSVHGFGMSHPLNVVALGPGLEVLDVRRLRPNRVVTVPAATYLLEIPETVAPPPVGARLEVVLD
jgi:hypothetical protein